MLKKIFILLLLSITLSAKPYMILHPRDCGMFSTWNDVLYLLYNYERGEYSGFEVDFGDEGFYYDKDKGLNSWNYYCKPIQLGINKGYERHTYGDYPDRYDRTLTRFHIKYLICKYIHIKPEIKDLVEKFCKENFKNKFIITVHYRGTDKFYGESSFVSYKQMSNHIRAIIQKTNSRIKYKIFVATDEKKFIDYLIDKFGECNVCYNKQAERSIDGLPFHAINNNNYQKGLDAIVDCLILSKGDYLLRTDSNLSLWSTFFNPNIPFYKVNSNGEKW